MSTRRRRLRAFTWLALVALLALALLPTLSHALAAWHGEGRWAEVCTPQGARQVVVDDTDAGNPAEPAQATSHFEHCPFCALSAGPLAPPPASPRFALMPRLNDAPPAAFLHAPRTPFAWRSAQPRGPPDFC